MISNPGSRWVLILSFFVILGYRRFKDMMPRKHDILSFLVGLTCVFFLESDSLSLLNFNLKVDVDEITVIDQSYPVSKLLNFLERNIFE